MNQDVRTIAEGLFYAWILWNQFKTRGDTKTIKDQVTPNGGGSMKDQVNAITSAIVGEPALPSLTKAPSATGTTGEAGPSIKDQVGKLVDDMVEVKKHLTAQDKDAADTKRIAASALDRASDAVRHADDARCKMCDHQFKQTEQKP